MSIHRYASSLPGSAGWVLLELLETPRNGIGQLMDALNLGERTIERAVADLVKLGLCQRDNRAVTLAHDALERCVNPVAQSVQSPSQGVNTASTSLATELTKPVLDSENQTPSRGGERDVLESKVLGVEVKPRTTKTQELKTPREKNSAPEPPPARERDEMFDAIAAVCYGGGDGLPDAVCRQIGAAKKSLERSGYSAPDMLSIGEFIKTHDEWRTEITPRVIVERAPAWRNTPSKEPRRKPTKPSLRAEDQFERLVREMGLTDAPPTITAQARAALPRGEN